MMRPAVVILTCFAIASALRAAPPPSATEIEALAARAMEITGREHAKPAGERKDSIVAERAWDDLLRATTRALALRGKAAEGYDRSRLFELRGEAQLRSNQFMPAGESFAAAAAEPGVPESRADACRTMALLMPRVDARGYRPPTQRNQAPAGVISMESVENRKRAAAAHLDNALADVEQSMKKILGRRALQAAARCIEANYDLRAVERFALENNDACDAQRRRIIDAAAVAMRTFIASARQSLVVHEGLVPGSQPSATQPAEAAQSAERIAEQCRVLSQDYATLVDAFGGEPPAVLADQTGAIQQIYDRTQRVRLNRPIPGENGP